VSLAVESADLSGKRADAKRAEQDFMELLQETEDITADSQWADVSLHVHA
jgi:hypothetical protein